MNWGVDGVSGDVSGWFLRVRPKKGLLRGRGDSLRFGNVIFVERFSPRRCKIGNLIGMDLLVVVDRYELG